MIVLTVGIALFFINVLMLWITDAIVGGIHFDGFVALVSASIVIWLVNMVLTWLPGPWRESKKKEGLKDKRAEAHVAPPLEYPLPRSGSRSLPRGPLRPRHLRTRPSHPRRAT